jgi:molybdopterin molybdotransferase
MKVVCIRMRLVGFKEFTRVEDAVNKLLSYVNVSLDVIELPINESLNYVCAEEVRAPYDIPPFDRSAVDGYAVKALSTTSASPFNPIYFKVLGTVEAGDDISNLRPVGEYDAYLVFTGARIPQGADAVVPVEDTVSEDGEVRILRPVPPYANISRKGEDFKEGDVILNVGVQIKPWHIAALASANISKVRVYRKVKVSIINTGSELVELGSELSSGKVVNSTKFLIESYLKMINVEPVVLGIVPDDLEVIRGTVISALNNSDIVIITGGTSVGGKDLVPEAVEGIEGSIKVFHGVAMRPGRTTGAYVVKGKPVLIVSGLPVACLVALEVFLKPLVSHLNKTEEVPKPTISGYLTRKLVNEVGFKSFYRVSICRNSNGDYYIEPLRLTGSGILSTLIRGNGILVIPENVEGYEAGERVTAEVINPIPECDDSKIT